MDIKKYQPVTNSALIEKWGDVIDGKGAWEEFCQICPKVDVQMRPFMAQMLENTEAEFLKETTFANSVGDYKPVLISMLRRIMPAQIGPRVLGTWGMAAPSQQIFAIRSVYQNTATNPVTRANSVMLTLADASAFTVGGDITGQASGAGVVRHIDGNNMLVEVSSGTFTPAANVDNANPYSAAATTISAVYENEAIFKPILKNYAGPYSTANGEALSTNMKQLGFKIDTATIVAETHKINTKWTGELEQDMASVHGMNAEQVLTQIATDEVDLEINQLIISKLRTAAAAGGTTAWSYSSADGRHEIEKYQNLMVLFSRVKRAILAANKRGQATFAIVSPAILAAIEHSGKLKTEGVDPMNSTFCGRALDMDIYCDIYAAANEIILGYKGNNELEAGIFYGVYKPLTVTKGIGQDDGQPRSFFSTRVGFCDSLLGTSNYYRLVTVSGLPA